MNYETVPRDLKTYNISEQQINPKLLTSILEIAKMAKIVYRQMPTPLNYPNKSPQKLACKSPWVGANFCKSPGVREGMIMDEIGTCIMEINSP